MLHEAGSKNNDYYLSEEFLRWSFFVCFDETGCREHDTNGHANGRSNQANDQFDRWDHNANNERHRHNWDGDELETMLGNVLRYLRMWLETERQE